MMDDTSFSSMEMMDGSFSSMVDDTSFSSMEIMDGSFSSKDISDPVFQSLGLRPNHALSAVHAQIWGSARADVALNPR